MDIGQLFVDLATESGFAGLFTGDGWQNLVMIIIALVLLFLGIVKKFEPLLLVGIAFGMLLSNLPLGEVYHPEMWNTAGNVDYVNVLQKGGLVDVLYIGVKTGVYPCLIFIGVGAMTDFGPMIANPKSLLLGAAAQLGVFTAFFLAICLGFTGPEAASIGIIGGADGPTAIWLTKSLAPQLLSAIAIAAYSYMALIPLIQPPLMKLIVPKKERAIKMGQLREVSKAEKIMFPIIVTVFTVLILPSVASFALMNIVTLFLGVSVGATAVGSTFLQLKTLYIIALGLFAFAFSTIGGLLLGRLMCKLTHGKINPLIGAAGVSAVPMAARVAHVEGLKANPESYLLMHAMGPNVAGVIGSAVAAGILMSVFG